MPAREDIDTILLIGSGPIVIGQACEFDYAGTQAISSLKEDGYKVVLVNSNPATIMTDPGLADKVYIEPLNAESLELIIEKERPCALLPTMGGQTALNLSIELEKQGILEKFGVQLIGADIEAIEKAEDREKFKSIMKEIGLSVPESRMVTSINEGEFALEEIGLPLVLRPSFTLGGTGGGIVYYEDQYWKMLKEGLEASPVGSVLVEQSILGWKEYEMEVVRDKNDNCIIVCSIENLDPMGVHTGDSITVAPALTLTDKEYQRMREASFLVLRKVGIETGGSNVQFAVHPSTGEMVVIEMNPRVSRSSALASKATGFPIARVAAKLAVGYSLDELRNSVTDLIPASFEPVLDYVVTKIPRFNFEKFPECDDTLHTSMQSVGEVMALGRTIDDSLQKAICSMDNGWIGFTEKEVENVEDEPFDVVLEKCGRPRWNRIMWVAQALRVGISYEKIHEASDIDPFFLRRIESLILFEKELGSYEFEDIDEEILWQSKQKGFSDARIGDLLGVGRRQIEEKRLELGVKSVYRRIDTVAGEFASNTPYLYSVYERPIGGEYFCESEVSDRRKVIIIGSGPNRIGQGVEFDYCCVHAVRAFRDEGIEAIMINCNPETVSTDFDTADRLYFEPLTVEHVRGVVEVERRRGELLGVVMQFGGQTPLKLAGELKESGVKILGTDFSSIDAAEDRDVCRKMLEEMKIKQPESGMAVTVEELVDEANKIGYPVMIRPSYVLGGRSMHRIWTEDSIRYYGEKTLKDEGGSAILIDRYLEGATEFDVDSVSDGEDVWVSPIIEHIEEAGIHSGDSACVIPDISLDDKIREEIISTTTRIAKRFNVVGLINIQYAIYEQELYVLEINPRASRTVPFISKALNIAIARIAAQVLAGRKLRELDLPSMGELLSEVRYAVKESVFPFSRFRGMREDQFSGEASVTRRIDIRLGPEMKSTGEVMAVGTSVYEAFFKAQEGALGALPFGGKIFVSLCNGDKHARAASIVRKFVDLGFEVLATRGTALFLSENGLEAEVVKKAREGGDNILNLIRRGEVAFVMNTPSGARSMTEAGEIRLSAYQMNIACATTLSWAEMAVNAIGYTKENARRVYALGE